MGLMDTSGHENSREYASNRRINVHYPPALPIVKKKEEIRQAIRDNQVVIICGETGSGKSTQIPKICLEAGRGIKGKIACTQPRRIAAVNIAHRISEEMGEAIGRTVGYKIRFEEKLTRHSIIKIMTDGMLLAETQQDPLLRQYDTVIVDEAHERSVNIDFILGILHTLLKKRKDLKVIITSATLDTEKFSRAFHHAPVIEVSGRMYQVVVRYRPMDRDLEEKGDLTYIDAAVDALDSLLHEEPEGDVLLFMPTEQDIRECCEILRGRNFPRAQIMPLYARLPWTDQRKVFQTAERKIIVATNIAETSLTIPGIRFVVDAGLARVLSYNPRTGTTSLPILPISQSSANQRKGRCGRVENGVCIRLYSEADYLTRAEFNTPEILRASLAGVVLRMLYLRLPDIHIFPFIDKPSGKAIRNGFDLLYELGAIERTKTPYKGAPPYQLTQQGRLMALLPIDPRVARMIIEGRREKCLHEIIVIASALSIQDPRERPAEKEKQADDAHRTLKNPQSDFLTLLNIWRHYGNNWETLQTQNKMRRFCRDHFLSYRRMREWQDIYHQIVAILQQDPEYCRELENGSITNDAAEASAFPEMPINEPRYVAIHKSILSGYLSNIAQKKDKKTFTAMKGREVFIFPASGLFQKSGKWIVAAEYIETSKLYCRTVANIEPEWLEKLGGHLCKRTYMAPHWDRDKGEVKAFLQVSLFGLIIIPRRLVSYGNIDPKAAEDIFFDALVDGEISQNLAFLIHNQRLIERIKRYEEKIRKRDLLVQRESQIDFYRSRISGISNVRDLRKFIFERGADDFLKMTENDLLARNVPIDDMDTDYPDTMQCGQITLQLTYAFDPGSVHDGVTLKVPIHALSMLAYDMIDYSVPGLKKAKIMGLLKELPKAYRKLLHPIGEKAAFITAKLDQPEKNFLSSLSRFIKNEWGIDIPVTAWSPNTLADHLQMHYEIVDEAGTVLSNSRNLNKLVAELSNGKETAAFAEARERWEKMDLASFPSEELPASIPFEFHGQIKGYYYPAMTDQGRSCSVQLFRDDGEARTAHQKGVMRCYALQCKDQINSLKKALMSDRELMFAFTQLGNSKERINHFIDKVILNVFDVSARNSKAFNDSLIQSRQLFFPEAQRMVKLIMPAMRQYDESSRMLKNLSLTNKKNPVVLSFLAEREKELKSLLPPDFLLACTEEDLPDLIRYIKAIRIRSERGCVNLEKDRTKDKEVMEFLEIYENMKNGLPAVCSFEKKTALSELIKMISEYRVSVFAQEIKTARPVSRKRLLDKIRDIKEMT